VRQRPSVQARATRRPSRPQPGRDQESPIAVQPPRRGSRPPPIPSRPRPDRRSRRSRNLGSRARAGWPGSPCGWYRESSPRARRPGRRISTWQIRRLVSSPPSTPRAPTTSGRPVDDDSAAGGGSGPVDHRRPSATGRIGARSSWPVVIAAWVGASHQATSPPPRRDESRSPLAPCVKPKPQRTSGRLHGVSVAPRVKRRLIPA
jgi:hypothetical protein